MDGKLDIDSFEKAINGLNQNLGQVGLLFRVEKWVQVDAYMILGFWGASSQALAWILEIILFTPLRIFFLRTVFLLVVNNF